MTDSAPFAENRRSVRLSVAVPVRLEFGHGTDLSGELYNLSQGGFFFAARPPRPVGTLLRFELGVPGRGEPIEGFGEVSWIRVRDDGAARPSGMGIRFRHLTDPGSTVLAEFLTQAAAQQLASPGPTGWVDSPYHDGGEGGYDDHEAPPPSLSIAGPWPDLPTDGSVDATFQFPIAPAQREGAPASNAWEPPTLNLDQASYATPSRTAASVGSSAPAMPWPQELAAGSTNAPLEAPGVALPAGARRTTTRPSAPLRKRPVVWIAGLALALGAAGYFGLQLLDRAEPAPNRPTRPSKRVSKPAATSTAAETTPVPAPPAEAPAVAPGEMASSAAPPELPTAAAPAAALTPARTLTDIRVTGGASGETAIELVADGGIDPARLRHQALSSPARLLLRISGIEEPFSRGNLAIGTPEVLRVRTGLHAEQGESTMHVVFDLASATVTIDRVEPTTQGVRVVFRSR